ncbi:genetic suppressor element 1-like isoform X2 [Phyllopteryx taeniolatus]|uniref:genetic suppressor element 1-like isoform X2 n=1 Tax=Phyllopteryx taeniolatus TaxID=161469 RepID=UPI002AD53887|nr:genetic suppressor element 1-like isoform X2 [Phyllopteryx taeniolatus]XP_061628538.1 genetic suppressor element 1-like isoform X2 [Phyllopteryx taeniolatus]XP_061628539.1 genetic suppressor element 1-like isoform X2 [Phyllopteryx taeniolatus]
MGARSPRLLTPDSPPPCANWPNRLRIPEVEPSVPRFGGGRERACADDARPPRDRRTPPVAPPHPLAHPFGLTPGSVMQDPRMQSLSLPGQMHPAVPSGAIPEEYLRALRPFATRDDPRLTSVPLGLDTAAAHAAAAAAAAAYYHSAFLHHPLSLPRMEESLCLSALRSQFYSVPAGGGAFPPLHPSGLHLHLPGGRYPAELNHGLLAERLQMENQLRQREREKEREEERERELDRLKERQRDRQQQMARAAEGRGGYRAEGPPRRAPAPEDGAGAGAGPTPDAADAAEESEHPAFLAHKPLPLSLHSSRGSVPHPVPSLVPSHLGQHHAAPGGSGVHGALAPVAMTRRACEEAWMKDSARTGHPQRGGREAPPSLGTPPPLISPKAPQTTLWNPASFVERPKPAPPSRPPPCLTRAERPPLKMEEGAGRRHRPAGEEAERDRLARRRHRADDLRPRPRAPLPDPDARRDGTPVYDEALRQHRRLLSKLDLEEKRRREAREGGFYYDLNESYDESDEDEVKAHLRRVTEQPPLKLNTSSEKVDFLRTCGLVTLAHRDELLQRKRRKRRRMMRERSTSPPPPPPAVRGKRKSPPSLTTPYTAEQMDGAPELQEKKDFLRAFELSHVSAQQRRDKEKTQELLRAVEEKVVTSDTLRYDSVPPCSGSPPAAASSSGRSSSCPSNGHLDPDSPSPSPPYWHKARRAPHNDALGQPPPLSAPPLVANVKKEPGAGVNGRVRPWETFTPEAFAQRFHRAVLQSTQHKVSKAAKGDGSLPRDASPLKTPRPSHAAQHLDGRRPRSPRAGRPERLTDEDADEGDGSSGEEAEDEEEGEAPRKWKGIEAIFEAYQEYADEHSVERQVLHSQCKRLEAQNYNLSRTAEQLSVTMAELASQRQRVREERERLHAQLEHFRRCLTLPSMRWGRGGHVNARAPR